MLSNYGARETANIVVYYRHKGRMFHGRFSAVDVLILVQIRLEF